MKQQLKLWTQRIQFDMIFFVLLGNAHFHNVVSTLTKVVKLNVEKDNVVLTLSNIVHINVEIHEVGLTLFDVVNSNFEIHVVSTLIWRCPKPRRHINQKTMLKQRSNVCWEEDQLNSIKVLLLNTNTSRIILQICTVYCHNMILFFQITAILLIFCVL